MLHPSAVPSGIDPGKTVGLLTEMEFIAEPLARGMNTYLIGSGFLQLVTFMGCSPHIELEPPPDGGTDFCHVQFHLTRSPQLQFGANTRPPRCPVCRKTLDISPASLATAPGAHCPHCGSESAIQSLGWRRDAGFADFFIEIHSVFPGEAVPTEGLLNRLKTLGGGDWRYFYLTQS